jgi:hypothetical protein
MPRRHAGTGFRGLTDAMGWPKKISWFDRLRNFLPSPGFNHPYPGNRAGAWSVLDG